MSSAGEVYSRLLLPKGHGCPIWCPEPANNLPLAYRETGVRIGHVGRVILDGGFDPLLNICAEADDAINFDGVPDCFEPLFLEPKDYTVMNPYHHRGSHICSGSLLRRHSGIGGEFTIQSDA